MSLPDFSSLFIVFIFQNTFLIHLENFSKVPNSEKAVENVLHLDTSCLIVVSNLLCVDHYLILVYLLK